MHVPNNEEEAGKSKQRPEEAPERGLYREALNSPCPSWDIPCDTSNSTRHRPKTKRCYKEVIPTEVLNHGKIGFPAQRFPQVTTRAPEMHPASLRNSVGLPPRGAPSNRLSRTIP